jgi:hypothetical protein
VKYAVSVWLLHLAMDEIAGKAKFRDFSSQ